MIPCFRSAAIRHKTTRRWGAARFHITDNQPALLPSVRREKLRRALYAGCERAPLGWENVPADLPTERTTR